MPEPLEDEMKGSESSILDLHQVDAGRSGGALPPKNTLLTSSHGSVMTVTTLAEEEDGKEPEEVGRVGGWIASFDKLLEDPLGVMCLQQFLEKEHCEENILFWKDAREFSEKALQLSSGQVQAGARKIYEQYLSPSSPHTVNVDDKALKGVETRLGSPVPNMFAEAQEQIYQLLKMDCYMRFKKSELVKECLLADMQGDPLPIGPATPITKNPWKKQKEFGFSRSLFGRFGRNKAPPSPPLPYGAGPIKSKKDSKGLKDSPGSRKTSRDPGMEKKRSSSEMARSEEFPPEKHLDILQAHKGNIFEVNLPNKVTKIMEVPKRGSVREALTPVLRKNNYSLDVMEIKFADTLKAVSLDSPAHILVGQHIIVLKSAQTFVATFPDGPERILPAGSRPVQELVAGILRDMGHLQNFAVYLENSRVPFNGMIEASTLVGQKVTVKYLGGQYAPADSNMDDLMSMIERLAGDTLEDQRTSPTPRNTPEPTSLSPASSSGGHPSEQLLQQQRTRSHGGSFRQRLSPRSSDSSPETRAKGGRQRSGSAREKKKLIVSHSIGLVGTTDQRLSPTATNDESSSPSSSRRFKRTQSGAVISRRKQQTLPEIRRTYSPPADVNSERRPLTSPPPPTSRPPPLPPGLQPYARPHNRSSEELLHESQQLSGVVGSQTPTLFPRVHPTMDSHTNEGSYGSVQDNMDRRSPSYGPLRSGSSGDNHPLDSFVREVSVSLPSGQPSTAGNHGRQHSMPASMPPETHGWNQPMNPHRYTQPMTAAHRHNLTRNPELMRTGDELVQREIEDYRHRQFTSSHSSSTSSTSAVDRPRITLSPTTHVLLPPGDSSDEHDQRETFV